MTDPASELAELLDRYASWQVEYQDHPPAWIATRRPSPAQVHVLAARDLGSLRDKLANAETLAVGLADLRNKFAGSGFRFGTVWASASATPNARCCMPAATACSSPPGPLPNCAPGSMRNWHASKPPLPLFTG